MVEQIVHGREVHSREENLHHVGSSNKTLLSTEGLSKVFRRDEKLKGFGELNHQQGPRES